MAGGPHQGPDALSQYGVVSDCDKTELLDFAYAFTH
jgi:hypothetical protein